MTTKHKIIKAYHKAQMVGICQICQELELQYPYQWQTTKAAPEEVPLKPPVKKYKHYEQGICKLHYDYFKEHGIGSLEKIIKAYKESKQD